MKNKYLSLCLVVILILSTSFVFAGDTDYVDKINNLEKEVEKLNQEVEYLQYKLMQVTKYESAIFSGISNGYQSISTTNGIFFITLEDIQKTHNGYKVVFGIGNPNYCEFENIDINIQYNKQYTDNTQYLEWSSQLKEQIFNFPSLVLNPGEGRNVELVLPVQDISELGYIEFKMMSNSISLKSNGSENQNTFIPLPQDNNTNVIESTIDGEFEGFEYERLFKLANGQIWKQTSFDLRLSYKFSPKVIIYKSDRVYKMKVDGLDYTITVEQIK